MAGLPTREKDKQIHKGGRICWWFTFVPTSTQEADIFSKDGVLFWKDTS